MSPSAAGHDLLPSSTDAWAPPLPRRALPLVTALHVWLVLCAAAGVAALAGSRWSRQEAARLGAEADALEAEATALEVEMSAERRRVAEAAELHAWLGAAPDLQRLLLSLGQPGLGGGYARRIVFEPEAGGGPLRVRLDVVRAGAEGRRLVEQLGDALGDAGRGPAVAESAEFGEEGGNVTFRCRLPRWGEVVP